MRMHQSYIYIGGIKWYTGRVSIRRRVTSKYDNITQIVYYNIIKYYDIILL